MESEEEEASLAWVAKEALHGDGVATRNQSQRSHIPSRIGVEIMLGCVMLEEIFSQPISLLTLLVVCWSAGTGTSRQLHGWKFLLKVVAMQRQARCSRWLHE